VVIHHRLLAQRLALLPGELEAQLAAVLLGVLLQEALKVFQQRLEPVRAHAVPAGRSTPSATAQVQAHLQLGVAVNALTLRTLIVPGS